LRWPAIVAILLVLGIAFRLWIHLGRDPVPEFLVEGDYPVKRVVDGDTLLLANGARVRLLGIDAPELHGDAPQPLAREATDFVRGWIGNRQVHLRFDRERVDRYGRFLAYVSIDDRLLNEALLRAGLARARTRFNYSERSKRIFRQAERDAQQAGRGIWNLD
jgi:micrococcal nuclease